MQLLLTFFTYNKNQALNLVYFYMEEPAGVEPAMMVLQTTALASWLWLHLRKLLYQTICAISILNYIYFLYYLLQILFY